MASEENDTVFADEDFDDDDDELSEEEDEEELEDDENDDVLPDPEDDDVINSASPSTSSPTVTVAVPSSSVSNAIVAVEPPIASSAITTTVITTSPAASAAAVATATTTPSPKRQRITIEPHLEEKKPQPIPIDDSRRLFQRLWTDEDEIELLQGFLDYTTSRGSTHHNDTALFYDQIKSKLQLDFNKNQLVEKLRRLKKKYRNVVGKISTGKDFSFKSPHDQATFEISRKIWSNSNINNNSNNRFAVVVDDSVFDDEDSKNPNLLDENANYNNSGEKKANSSRKRSRSRVRSEEKANNGNENVVGSGGSGGSGGAGGGGGNLGGMIEETVKSCLSPLFKELLSNAMGGSGFGGRGFGFGGMGMNAMAMNAMPLNFGGGESGGVVDEKWRKQQILELEVYSKRLDLVQDQIRAALDELRSMGGWLIGWFDDSIGEEELDVSGLILLFLVDEYLLVFIGSVAELIAFGFLYFFFFLLVFDRTVVE